MMTSSVRDRMKQGTVNESVLLVLKEKSVDQLWDFKSTWEKYKLEKHRSTSKGVIEDHSAKLSKSNSVTAQNLIHSERREWKTGTFKLDDP